VTDTLRNLLLEAVMKPAAERSAYLDRHAGHDPSLRARLERLIDAWDQASTILRDTVALSPSDYFRLAAQSTEREGDRIGEFVLVEPLGEGGFGIVWRAKQESPVRRDVAVKILKPGMDSADFLARFDAERQALARLTHASIARIFDAGVTPAGRPFFAMELVDGQPIAEFADRHRLSIRERLVLFREVCLAVHHAHQKGVIHRDLKPSNILVSRVDGKPLPKVIDFGTAKATGAEPLSAEAVVTLARQIVGTPRYMSPEQASLDSTSVDTRSDVYSLGVVLYELLCGSTPLTDERIRSLGLLELHRALMESRFDRPSARFASLGQERERVAAQRATQPGDLDRALASELDWIVARALAPDPADRYPSAAALAADVDNRLENRPVTAHPPSTVYQIRKFARRHTALVIAAAACVLLLVAGVIGTSIGLARAVRAEREARASAAEANAVSAFLEKTISAADPSNQGRDVRVADLLDEAVAGLDEQFESESAVKARIQATLAGVYNALGDLRSAEGLYAAALAGRRATLGEAHFLTLRTRGNLIGTRYRLGDVRGALDESELLLEVLKSSLGEDSEEYLDTLTNHAVFLSAIGPPDDALLATQARVVELQRELRGEGDERAIGSMANLASLYRDFGRLDETERVEREALALALEHHGPEAPISLFLRSNLANTLDALGRTDESERERRTTLLAQEKVLGPTHPSTLLTRRNLAAALLERDAALGFETARPVFDAVPRALPMDHRITQSLPSLVVEHASDAPSDLALKSIEIIRANESNPSAALDTLDRFVQALVALQSLDPEAGEAAVRLARANEARAADEMPRDRWAFAETVAFALFHTGHPDEAAAEQRRAIALAEEVGLTGPDRETMSTRLAEYTGAE